jgi:hypothetical protein
MNNLTMKTFAFSLAARRRRLAWGGALFLAFDAVLMGVAILTVTGGRELGLAVALAGAGVLASTALALVLARPPRAALQHGVLLIEAGFQRVSITAAGAQVSTVDLRHWPSDDLPTGITAPRWWQAGDAFGWQRNRDGRPWFAAIRGRGIALCIDGADGERAVIEPADPIALCEALRAAGARVV